MVLYNSRYFLRHPFVTCYIVLKPVIIKDIIWHHKEKPKYCIQILVCWHLLNDFGQGCLFDGVIFRYSDLEHVCGHDEKINSRKIGNVWYDQQAIIMRIIQIVI